MQPRDVALILETRTELMTELGLKTAPRNFWVAVGKVYGMDAKIIKERVYYYMEHGYAHTINNRSNRLSDGSGNSLERVPG